MIPCLPAVDIEATPEEPEPEPEPTPSVSASASASAARPVRSSEISAKPQASASARATPPLHDDPSTVF